MNSVFSLLIISVCGVSKWMPVISNWVFESASSRERSGLEITDLGDRSNIRTMRVDEIIQGKQRVKRTLISHRLLI